MNSKKITVAVLLGIVVLAFAFGMKTFQNRELDAQQQKTTQNLDRLVRMHSPVLGPRNAPVTIVEFFDPACETCRAFYPIVKNLMRQYPDDVRLVLRYAPFHQGSDQVIHLLEAAKKQDKYWPVLEMVLAAQPLWADHGHPNVELAFQAAAQAGLDLPQALKDAAAPDIAAVLQQDVEDLKALQVTKTPSFFVNGQPLQSFGAEQLAALVAQEVAKTKQ